MKQIFVDAVFAALPVAAQQGAVSRLRAHGDPILKAEDTDVEPPVR